MKKMLGLAALAVMPTAAFAAPGFTYNYLEAGFSSFDIDVEGETTSGDGYGLAGSFDIGEHIFIFVEHDSASAEESFSDPLVGSVSAEVTLSTTSLGIGRAWPLSERVDFVGGLAWVKARAELDMNTSFFGGFSFSESDNGYGARAGLRGYATDALELFGTVSYIDVFEDSETAIQIGSRYWLSSRFGLAIAYESADDVEGFTFSGRYQF